MKCLPLLVLFGTLGWTLPITSGSAVFYGIAQTNGNIVLQGDGFEVEAFIYGGLVNSSPYPVGATIAKGFYAYDFGSSTATIDGVFYPLVVWSSMMGQASSRLETVTEPVQLTGPGVFYSTFQLTGHLCGHTSFPTNRPCDILFPSVTGSGIATFPARQVDNWNGTASLEVNPVTFTFTTPEPATVWTIAAGLGLIAWRRRAAAFLAKRNLLSAR